MTAFLRDGVGDGQINYVLEHEIKAIEKCFQAAGINQSELKFTYIIVSKRINTRFFRYLKATFIYLLNTVVTLFPG